MINSVKIARALSDPVRYKILQMLAQKETGCCPLPGGNDSRPGFCNCELMSELGMIQSRVSYHMRELIDAELVEEEPRGKWRVYFINTKTLRQFQEQLNQDFALK